MDQIITPTTAATPKRTGEMCIMDRTGDSKHIWDPDNQDEVAAMRDLFNSYRKKGFLAYKVTGKNGIKGEQINEFDPEAGRIIFSPPLVGG